MEISNKILINREEKNHFIKTLVNDYQVISLKANIPGLNKNTKEAYILLAYFDKALNSYGLTKSHKLDGADGPMYIYLTSKDENIKDKMIQIEEETLLGRFIDIDVFNNSISQNRKTLRKCYICDNPAFVCARNKTHKLEELIEHIEQNIEKELCKIVKLLCDESIMEELNIHPKFGLVTPYSNGSHKDMNYELMLKAKDAILDSFVQMFLVGYKQKNLKEIFKQIRKIGQDAENKMFNATQGINAYKGLIFDLGLIVASIGYKISHLNSDVNIFDNVKEMTEGITKELESGNDTFGKLAYQTYKIGGARLEAENGFPHVKEILNKDTDNLQSLIYLISNIDDTVLLKRCNSYQKYRDIKKKFTQLEINKESINRLTTKCIQENLSFGGAADLLIVMLFIKKINNIIKIY